MEHEASETDRRFIKRLCCYRIALAIFACFSFIGCVLFPPESPEKSPIPMETGSLENYKTFIADNMARVNAIYSTRYAKIEFIVDTPVGSTKIQDLIQPAAVLSTLEEIAIDPTDHRNRAAAIHQYMLAEFDFKPTPDHWQTIAETLDTRQGDCKSLSILLLSLLLAADITAHAAISNGHMWVNALYDGRWHILETDTDPERNRIYALPGFYDHPLYKIYPDISFKRKRRVH